ncbi:MAG: phosphatidylserine decarboxylase, partial [Steroidobacteraceae bacterium]|nr:phosphatidylserine decarboxylase [Steroidobacteraceae bacterium]
MTPSPRPSLFSRIAAQKDLNFLLTNRIPRNALTHLVGRLSKIENPVVRDLSIGLWRAFADLDLADARTTQFRSMHDCFTRQLRDGARPIDPDDRHLTSPCDGIVGAHGRIDGDT